MLKGVTRPTAHEVSHIKSRQGVAADVNYFEEEMRAWLVGTYAGTRKLPNKLQAANRAYFLLSFKSDTGLEAYDFISRGWNDHPETFKRHLKELGLGKLTPQSSTDETDKIFEAIKHDDPAPLWGWEGFLMNEPRPTSKMH